MNKIINILCNDFGVSEEDINETISLLDLGLDSISIVEFQIQIERSFGLKEETLGLINEDSLLTIMTKVEKLKNEE